ncbi:hypothetical protein SERLA73DRAFT_177321 [Serpula lacrymans var. lacrymans S7.3]|uniref:AB hydrolase-1 domain-containing protein n=2 Tax=Serpula lacrymans var. lacrymans TaxID=341189 RepID=F8PNS7_SERL3|nr:uncharacterized protein SERLADRAFT_460855 [Serpula lacrymans var. lacrymans S7.9]EGO01804.1 hypothetical protein SERLA73DRAFT_177321 [Serpula lacrymans var. lacrymans S7.3]EGO27436.1 hypothetical protein SERLADRAFT_460855 [Serpula lacrymans var. lacrymans S7.9]
MDESVEKKLALPGGRTLAYAEAGTLTSTTIILYLHGAFTVGEASKTSQIILSKNIRYVAPTLPGWGNTSPPLPSTSYPACLTSDITALLEHLYPNNHAIKLYIAGGSFGTVPAQILFGAPYDAFPFGRYIAGVLLLGALSPFHYHVDYAKHMSWSNYIMAGPPARFIPFKLIPRLVKFIISKQLATEAGAEAFLRKTLFDTMDQAELEEYARWRERQGIAEGETELNMAKNAIRSVAKSWEGFSLMSDVLHADWGFHPNELDENHSRPPVLLVFGKDDKMAPEAMSQYLAANYKNSRCRSVDGGHLAVLYHLDSIWTEFLANEHGANAGASGN